MAKIFNKGYVNDAVPPEPGENKFIVSRVFMKSQVFWERGNKKYMTRGEMINDGGNCYLKNKTCFGKRFLRMLLFALMQEAVSAPPNS